MELQRPAALDAEYAKTGVKGHFLGVWGKKPYFLVHTDTGEEAMTANDFERHAGGLLRLQHLLLVCDALGVAASPVLAGPVYWPGARLWQCPGSMCCKVGYGGLQRIVACL